MARDDVRHEASGEHVTVRWIGQDRVRLTPGRYDLVRWLHDSAWRYSAHAQLPDGFHYLLRIQRREQEAPAMVSADVIHAIRRGGIGQKGQSAVQRIDCETCD